MSEERKNFCKPYLNFWGKTVAKCGEYLFKPFSKCFAACEGDTCCLWFWGCCWCVLPICIAWTIVALTILLLLTIIFAIIGLILGICGVLVGIWPAFIITFGVTGVTIIRLPFNLFYTFKVTYRSVCIRTGLRIISFLILPILHILFPIFTFLIVGVCSLAACISISFCGDCLKPWDKMPVVFQKFWKIYVTDAKKFSDDYGHPSGVPADWDGRVYGIPLDPLTVVFGIILFIYGLIVVSIGNFLLFTVKGPLIYIYAIIQFAMEFTPLKALKYYGETISDYAKLGCSDKYWKIIKGYADCFPIKAFKDQGCCMIIVLSWLILLGLTSWIVGLVFVIIGPPLSYMIGWVLIIVGLPIFYVFAWVCALVGPPIGYVLAVAFGPFLSLRCPYVALKHNILRPGQLSKSLKFGFKEPLVIFKKIDKETASMSFNIRVLPGSQDDGVTAGNQNWQRDVQAIQKVKYWDLFFGRCRSKKNWIIENNWLTEDDVICAAPNVMIAIPAIAILDVLLESLKTDINNKSLIVWNDQVRCDDKTRDRADDVINVFWPRIMSVKSDLKYVIDKSAKESKNHVSINMENATNAAAVEAIEMEQVSSTEVPGDKIEKTYTPTPSNGEQEKTSCWGGCYGSKDRIPKDIVISDLLDKEIHYINAKICSGDDEQTQALKDAANLFDFGEEKNKDLNRICANVTDVVLTLLRVREFTSGFAEVLQ